MIDCQDSLWKLILHELSSLRDVWTSMFLFFLDSCHKKRLGHNFSQNETSEKNKIDVSKQIHNLMNKVKNKKQFLPCCPEFMPQISGIA